MTSERSDKISNSRRKREPAQKEVILPMIPPVCRPSNVCLSSHSYHLLSLIISFYDASRILSAKNMFTLQWGVLNGKRLSEALRVFLQIYIFRKGRLYSANLYNHSYQSCHVIRLPASTGTQYSTQVCFILVGLCEVTTQIVVV